MIRVYFYRFTVVQHDQASYMWVAGSDRTYMTFLNKLTTAVVFELARARANGRIFSPPRVSLVRKANILPLTEDVFRGALHKVSVTLSFYDTLL